MGGRRAEPIVSGRSSGAEPSLADVGRWSDRLAEGVVDRVGQLVGRDGGGVEGSPTRPVGQYEVGDASEIVDVRGLPPLQPGEGGGGAAQDQVGPQALGARGEGQPAGRRHHVVADLRRPGRADALGELAVGALATRRLGIAVEREPPAHGLDAIVHGRRRRHVDAQAEAVEQLWAQLALLRVHRTDEHEPRRMAVRHAVALDDVLARHGDVEQRVDQVVGQQVDLVDVEDATVGGGEQARAEHQLPAGERGRDVERADEAIFRGAERELGEASQHGRQPPGQRRLGRTLVTAQQDAADQRIDCCQPSGRAWRHPARPPSENGNRAVIVTPPNPRPPGERR